MRQWLACASCAWTATPTPVLPCRTSSPIRQVFQNRLGTLGILPVDPKMGLLGAAGSHQLDNLLIGTVGHFTLRTRTQVRLARRRSLARPASRRVRPAGCG